MSKAERVKSNLKEAIEAKTDHLKGLKENVIIGRLIPAGTGNKNNRSIFVKKDETPVESESTHQESEEVGVK